MQQAVSSQHAIKRRREQATKDEEDRSAVYEAYPTLPGKLGGTKAIFDRLSSEALGRTCNAMNSSSQKPCTNSKGKQLAEQKGSNLLTQGTAGRITTGEMHAINNILKDKPQD